MSARENKRQLQNAFTELAKGNGEPFVDALAEDIRWTIIGTTAWSGNWEGKRSVRDELFGSLFAQFAGRYTNSAQRLVAEGDHVVVESRGNVTTKSGKPYNNTYCYVCRMADGKVHELTEYCDTELLSTALSPPQEAAPT